MSIVTKRLDGSIKILPGTEVGLGPSDIVFDGDPAPLRTKGHSSPSFRPSALARILPVTRNPYCRLGSARRAALVAVLQIIATRLVFYLRELQLYLFQL